MHLEIDRKAPPQTYKERTGLEAACAVLSCVILFHTTTESPHCTEGKIRAALFLACWAPAIPLCRGVKNMRTHNMHQCEHRFYQNMKHANQTHWLRSSFEQVIRKTAECGLQKDLSTPLAQINLPHRCSKAVALNLWRPDRMCLIQPRTSILCWAASAVCFNKH